MKKLLVSAAAFAVLALVGTEARAEGHVFRLPGVVVVGRPPTPLAAIEITKAEPNLTAALPNPTFTPRVENATGGNPF